MSEMTNEVEKLYKEWINGPDLFSHVLDQKRFYRFAKAYIHYGDYKSASDSGKWLREKLKEDKGQNNSEQQEHAAHVFGHIIEYEKEVYLGNS